MPEEPDGGRDAAGEPVERRDEFDDLEPAVRRVADAESDDAVAGADEGATESGDDRWSDLTPAIEPAGDDAGDWEWSEDDYPNLSPGTEGSEDVDPVPDEREPPGVPSDPDGRDSPGVPDDPDATVVDAEDTPNPAGPAAPDDVGTGGVDVGGALGGAPDSDVEQPLAVHVEEMVKRLAIVIAVAGLVSVTVFPLTESLINTIWNHVLPGGEAVDPRIYHPLELLITQLKVASLAGLVVALPVFVYESYAFMRPGLYENERRYYLAAVPTSLVLAVLGVVFSYFVVLPYTMSYFQGYTENTANVAFALGTTFNLILMVMGYLAVVFQIPLFIMLAIMLGVVTRRWLEDRRLLFWGAFAGIAFAFGSIDPTGVVPVLVAITMIVLFEGTLALLRWTGN